jgi:hypothetical protein
MRRQELLFADRWQGRARPGGHNYERIFEALRLIAIAEIPSDGGKSIGAANAGHQHKLFGQLGCVQSERGVWLGDIHSIERLSAPNARLMRIRKQNINHRTGLGLDCAVHEAHKVLAHVIS